MNLVGTPQAGSTINAQDVTLTFDVAPQEGDMVLVFGGPAVAGPSGIVTPGYTAITPDGLGSQARSWYKVMGATPDIAVVCDGGADVRDAVVYLSYVLRDADIANVLDAVAVRTSGAAGAAAKPGAITTVTNGAWVFAFASYGAVDNTPGALAGYTGQAVVTGDHTFNSSITGMYKEVAAAGVEDPPAYDGWAASAWACNTVAIRPMAATPVPVPVPTPMAVHIS